MSSSLTDQPFTPNDYDLQFDGSSYLHHYFSSESLEHGTRLTLFALPIFASVIRTALPPERRRKLVDIGSGPTIYSAVCFRDVVEEVYLTDYSESCLLILNQWLRDESDFSWDTAIRKILSRLSSEGRLETTPAQVEGKAREVVLRGGIHRVDIHQEDVGIVRRCAHGLGIGTVDVLVTVFCLESASSELGEYKRALGNVLKLLRPGGFFILGTLIGHDAYIAGTCKRTKRAKYFKILSLTEEFVVSCLEELGMNVKTMKKLFMEEDGTLFLLVEKHGFS